MLKRIAIIFDLDGTLVDTEIIHAEAESRLLDALGVKITPEEITRNYAGIPTENYIKKVANCKKSLVELILEKNQIMNDLVREKGIHPIFGMPKLVSYLSESGVPIFLASSSNLEWIKRCLNASFQIDDETYSYGDYFKCNFISCSEISNPKPAPDVFMEARKRMQNEHDFLRDANARWIVVGDSLVDAEGAFNANMEALIWGKFKERLIKDGNAMVFSAPEKMANYIKNMIRDIKN